MKKLFILAIVVLGFTAVSFAQIGTASATLGYVLTVSQTTPLNFGSISLPTNATPSTLNMTSAGVVTPIAGTAIPIASTRAVGSFLVSGVPLSSVDVTVAPTITLSDGLTIATDGIFADVILDASGVSNVLVYGVLTVPGLPLTSGVKAGTYAVTVNY